MDSDTITATKEDGGFTNSKSLKLILNDKKKTYALWSQTKCDSIPRMPMETPE